MPGARGRSWVTILRWALLVPATYASWLAIVFLTMLAVGSAEKSLCPPEQFISGFCDDPAVRKLADRLLLTGAALSAAMVVAVSAAVAPSHRAIVAWIAYGTGAAVALKFAGLVPESIAALVGGLVAVLAFTALNQRQRRKAATGTRDH
jgi:MFS family permease